MAKSVNKVKQSGTQLEFSFNDAIKTVNSFNDNHKVIHINSHDSIRRMNITEQILKHTKSF